MPDIEDKLHKLIALIAMQNKEPDEQVRALSLLEYSIDEISLFTGIPTRTVIRKRAALKINNKKNGKRTNK